MLGSHEYQRRRDDIFRRIEELEKQNRIRIYGREEVQRKIDDLEDQLERLDDEYRRGKRVNDNYR